MSQRVSPATLLYLRRALRAGSGSNRCSSSSRRLTVAPLSRPLHIHGRSPGAPLRASQHQLRHNSSASASPSANGISVETLPSQKQQKTYYDLFPNTCPSGPPPKGPYTVDLRALRAEFLKEQARVHPDIIAAGSARGGQRGVEAASALLNEAYNTLRDPLRRAQYALELAGVATGAEEDGKLDGAGGDSELLMEVMEVNEAIEEAGNGKDIIALSHDNGQRIRGAVEKLDALFAKGNLEGARQEAVRLRYWVNIKQSLDDWEEGKPVVLVH